MLPFESIRTIPIKSQHPIAGVAKYAQDDREIVFNNPPIVTISAGIDLVVSEVRSSPAVSSPVSPALARNVRLPLHRCRLFSSLGVLRENSSVAA